MLALNEFPSRPAPYRIALVAEAAGQDEERLGRPFVGSSGKLLDACLSAASIPRGTVFVGNVCQARPPGNRFDAWAWDDERVQSGIATLLTDLRTFAPNLVVTCGNVPLHLLRHGNVAPPRTKAGYDWPSKVTLWRGSLFLAHESFSTPPEKVHCEKCAAGFSLDGCPECELLRRCSLPLAHESLFQPAQMTPAQAACEAQEVPREGAAAVGGSSRLAVSPRWKVLATYHPAFVLRAWAKLFDLRQDLKRAATEGTSPALVLDAIAMEWGPGENASPVPDYVKLYHGSMPPEQRENYIWLDTCTGIPKMWDTAQELWVDRPDLLPVLRASVPLAPFYLLPLSTDAAVTANQ